MNILVIGAPASGKGTLCKKIAKEFGFKHISTGDIFRAEIASGSEKGKLIEKFINKGKLAPSDILIETMKEYLSKPENRDNMLLDGFGKTLEEAKALDNFFKIDKVFYLDAEYENLVSRVSKRRVCADCGMITTIDEAVNEKCPKCEGDLTIRSDDTEEIYKTRISVFQEQTLPIVDYFKSQNRLVSIDANKEMIAVYNQVKKIVAKCEQNLENH